jgi:Lon protease-like protein
MTLPLHIFEERYKKMIAKCLADDSAFGIVLFEGQAIRKVGCTTRVTEVLRRYDDGRLDIATRGEQRFVIRDIIDDQAYLEARATFFDDSPDDSDPALEEAAAEARTRLARMAALVDLPALGALAALEDPRQLSFAIPAIEGFTPAERQHFLEMTSVRERLQKGLLALDRLLERLKLNSEIKRLIGGNGHALGDLLK